jgi:hypothetical protein
MSTTEIEQRNQLRQKLLEQLTDDVNKSISDPKIPFSKIAQAIDTKLAVEIPKLWLPLDINQGVNSNTIENSAQFSKQQQKVDMPQELIKKAQNIGNHAQQQNKNAYQSNNSVDKITNKGQTR